MSDVMLFGVLRMPPELWQDSEIDKRQRYARYVEAADRIDRLTAENEVLRKENFALATHQCDRRIFGEGGDALCGHSEDAKRLAAENEKWRDGRIQRVPMSAMFKDLPEREVPKEPG